MADDNILIRGNKDGLNIIIDMDKFKNCDDMLGQLILRLSQGKKFYEGAVLTITIQLRYIDKKEIAKLKVILFEEFLIKECIFNDKEETVSKVFSGIYEGKTKFIRTTVRSGQIVKYQGNVVVVGDVNPGAEIHAAGNIIVLGSLKGNAHAGNNGNSKAIIAAFQLEPKLLQISNIVTIAPEDDIKTSYPEVAKIKGNSIIVEPYSPNKFI